MHVLVFTRTCSYVDGHEVILSWVRQSETVMLCERKKGSPSNHRIRDRNGRRNSVVELPNKRVGDVGDEARSVLQIVNGQTTGYDQDTFLPEFGDRLSECPIAFGAQGPVDRCLHNWHAVELLAEHESERNEDAVVQAGPLEPSTVSAAGFVFRSQTGADACLMEKLDYAPGECGVSARAKLEIVELRRKAVIIHEQRILVSVVRHELLSLRFPVGAEDEYAPGLVLGEQGGPKIAQKVGQGARWAGLLRKRLHHGIGILAVDTVVIWGGEEGGAVAEEEGWDVGGGARKRGEAILPGRASEREVF